MAHAYPQHQPSAPRGHSSRRHDSSSAATKPSVRYDDHDSYGTRTDKERGRPGRYAHESMLQPPGEDARHGRSHRSLSRHRHRWPPLPTCEDERTSLLREVGGRKLLQEMGRDDVVSRGSVDQEPVIADIPTPMNSHERRFTAVPDSRSESSTGMPTPPTSEDERARKARRRPSRISTDGMAVPEMNRRTASPYAFKPTRTGSNGVQGNHLLSPEVSKSRSAGLQIPLAGLSVGSRSQPSSPNRDREFEHPSRRNDGYFAGSESIDDNAIHDEVYDSTRSERYGRKQATYPPSPSKQTDKPDVSPRTSVVDFAPRPSVLAQKQHLSDVRRHTDTAETLPTLAKVRAENSRRQSTLTPANSSRGVSSGTAHLLSSSVPRAAVDPQSPRSRQTSRNGSPNLLAHSDYPSPPRSPRASFDSVHSYQSSRPASRDESHSSSRPSTPSASTTSDSPRLPRTDTDWSTLMAANASRRSKPPSKLNSSMRQSSMPQVPQVASPRIGSGTAAAHSGLPYPLDDGFPMVTSPIVDQDIRKVTEPQSILQLPIDIESKRMSRSISPTRRSTSFSSVGSMRNSRPPVLSHNSSIGLSESSSQRSSSFARPATDHSDPSMRITNQPSSSQTGKEIYALAKQPLPVCRRPDPIDGKEGWYTLNDAQSLQFCPDCVDGAFEQTLYRKYLRRGSPYPLSTEIRCALGGKPWIRLAWIMTLQQQRTDLSLLKDMVEIEQENDPCPGRHESVRSWYSLRDQKEGIVQDFRMCHSDVRKIERLLPNLSGMFVRVSSRDSSQSRRCSLRADGNRFTIYTDSLIAMNNKAYSSRHQAPDPTPFIDLIYRVTGLPKCPRDASQTDRLWHTHPKIPQLTICEDCFATFVAPISSANPDTFVTKFPRKAHIAPAQPPTEEDEEFDPGQTNVPAYNSPNDDLRPGGRRTCQLYSIAMRRVFVRAVRKDDLGYLLEKAKERRSSERRLHEKLQMLDRRVARRSREVNSFGGYSAGSGGGGGNGSGFAAAAAEAEEEMKRLDRERVRILA